jgi:hypothetical protein
MERYLKAKVWEQTGKSETHLSHFEKWFSSSTALSLKKKKIVGRRNASRTETREVEGDWKCPNITRTTSTKCMGLWEAPNSRSCMNSNPCTAITQLQC